MNTSRYAKQLRWVATGLALAVAVSAPLASWTAVAEAQVRQAGAPATAAEPTDAQKAGAGLMNVFHVPGKAIVCGIGTLTTVTVLLITFGSGYRAAARVFDEGCGGDWVITPDHVSGKIPPKGDLD